MSTKKNHASLFESKIIVFFLLFSSNFWTQSTSIEFSNEGLVNISFEQRISPEQIGLSSNESISWSIMEKNELLIDGENTGLSLFDYTWNNPGEYTLLLAIKHDGESNCTHDDHSYKWNIQVSPIQIKFNIDAITFSKSLNQASLESGIKLTVPVELKTFSQTPNLDINTLKVLFQGVGCSVHASPLSPNTMNQPGKYLLEYDVQGTAEKGAYIMIDFYDHNGNISTYYHLNQL
jgi:hypothetical protein